MNFVEGGHSRVDKGNNLGILFLLKKSISSISSSVGLISGSFFNILYISFLAASEMYISAGNEKMFDSILLKVVFIFGVSNGGLPISKVYLKRIK